MQEHLATLTTDEISRAVAAIDDDGRFWMAVKDKIFVLSYFPGSKISGWTWYEPGFDVDDIAVLEGRIYVRSGDTIYLYGGVSNAAYESCQVVVQMPFLDAGKPGNMRNLEGMDIASEGDWLCELLVDPRDTSRKVQVGYLSGNTWLNMNSAGYASTSHFAPRLTSVSDGYVSLSAISVSFTGTADEK